MKSAFLLALAILALTGCLEGGPEFKEWAKKESRGVIEGMIASEAESRVAIAIDHGLTQALTTLSRIDSESAPITEKVLKTLEMQNLTYRMVWQAYLDHGFKLLRYADEVEVVDRQIQTLKSVCEDVTSKFVPEPIDVLALMGTVGQEYYYVGVTMSSDGSQAGADDNIIFTFINLLDRYIFSASQYADYEEGLETLKKNVPNVERRREIFQDACIPVRDGLFDKGLGATVDLVTKTMMTRFQRISYGLALSGIKMYWQVSQKAFEGAPYDLDESHLFIQSAMTQINLNKDLGNQVNLMMSGVSRLHLAIASQLCSEARKINRSLSTISTQIKMNFDSLSEADRNRAVVKTEIQRSVYWHEELRKLRKTPEAQKCNL